MLNFRLQDNVSCVWNVTWRYNNLARSTRWKGEQGGGRETLRYTQQIKSHPSIYDIVTVSRCRKATAKRDVGRSQSLAILVNVVPMSVSVSLPTSSTAEQHYTATHHSSERSSCLRRSRKWVNVLWLLKIILMDVKRYGGDVWIILVVVVALCRVVKESQPLECVLFWHSVFF
jgi:hypothetical protein